MSADPTSIVPLPGVLSRVGRDIRACMRIPQMDAESAAGVLEALASGRTIESVGGDESFPAHWVIARWRAEHPDFDALCAEAIEAFADKAVRDVVEIADTVDEHPASRAVRIDTRLKVAKLLNRDRYGDKKSVDVTTHQAALAPEERDARIAALLEEERD